MRHFAVLCAPPPRHLCLTFLRKVRHLSVLRASPLCLSHRLACAYLFSFRDGCIYLDATLCQELSRSSFYENRTTVHLDGSPRTCTEQVALITSHVLSLITAQECALITSHFLNKRVA